MTMIENWCLLQNKLNFNDEYDANQKDWGMTPVLMWPVLLLVAGFNQAIAAVVTAVHNANPICVSIFIDEKVVT